MTGATAETPCQRNPFPRQRFFFFPSSPRDPAPAGDLASVEERLCDLRQRSCEFSPASLLDPFWACVLWRTGRSRIDIVF